MFQMYPGALETEVQRRRELAMATMRAVHGTTFVDRRVIGVARVRHVVALIAAVAPALS